MIPDRSWLRALVPVAFAVGACATAACLFWGSAYPGSQRKSEPFRLSRGPERAYFTFDIPSLVAAPPSVERRVRCRVHGSEIKTILVPVEYGLPLVDDRRAAYLAAAEASFPHCDDAIWGGCIVQSNNEDLKEVCEGCNVARDRWLQRRPRK